MELNEIGEIVDREWKRTFAIRPDMNSWMDEFVVMPNHFHAIIGIGVNKYNIVETHCNASRQTPKNKFGPQSKNLASIIRGFR
jgi:REP element-mobilizing transposase RayT